VSSPGPERTGLRADGGRHGTNQSIRPVTRVEAWERRTAIPLLLLAVAFLVAYGGREPVLPFVGPDRCS
jgi:hypothetical protein